MRSTLRQPLFFLILLIVSVVVLSLATELESLTLGGDEPASFATLARRAGRLVFPAALLALALTPLAAVGTGRGGAFLAAALAFAAALFLPDMLGAGGEASARGSATADIPTRRFVKTATEGEFLYVTSTSGGLASGVVSVSTSPREGEPYLSYASGIPPESLPIAPDDRSGREVIAMEPALRSLSEDVRRVIRDIRVAPAGWRRLVRVAAPLAYLAGLVVVVRLSTWPAVAAAVSLLLARGGFALYSLLAGPGVERVRSQMGELSGLFPSLALLGCGLVLILMDALTPGAAAGNQRGVWRE